MTYNLFLFENPTNDLKIIIFVIHLFKTEIEKERLKEERERERETDTGRTEYK